MNRNEILKKRGKKFGGKDDFERSSNEVDDSR